tara:strand:+ start:430 stop:1119 length:690 start_codon:yes stop_codon:yes gene_type:complete
MLLLGSPVGVALPLTANTPRAAATASGAGPSQLHTATTMPMGPPPRLRALDLSAALPGLNRASIRPQPASHGAGHGGRPLAPDSEDEAVLNSPEADNSADPQDSKYLWMQPYITPWNNPSFASNWDAWKTQVYSTYMARQPDYEYRAEFVPGIGSMRPFVKPARPIPPPEIQTVLSPGPIAETLGTSGGLMGFLVSSWYCYLGGNCGTGMASSTYDPTTGVGTQISKGK